MGVLAVPFICMQVAYTQSQQRSQQTAIITSPRSICAKQGRQSADYLPPSSRRQLKRGFPTITGHPILLNEADIASPSRRRLIPVTVGQARPPRSPPVKKTSPNPLGQTNFCSEHPTRLRRNAKPTKPRAIRRPNLRIREKDSDWCAY